MVHEPRPETRARSSRVKRRLSYRRVVPRGRWQLAILCGRWRLTLRDQAPVTADSDDEEMREALSCLDGQKLTRVRIERARGATRLEFDLGAVLEIAGSDCDDGDMLTLYRPRDYVVSVRADGRFSHYPGSRGPPWWRLLPERADV